MKWRDRQWLWALGCLSLRLGGERIFVFGWVVGKGGVFSQGWAAFLCDASFVCDVSRIRVTVRMRPAAVI